MAGGPMARKKQTPTETGQPGDAHHPVAPVDRRALKALLGTYWTAGGWRGASGNTKDTPPPVEEEVEYARKAGYMFEPRAMTHDQAVAWLLRVRASVVR